MRRRRLFPGSAVARFWPIMVVGLLAAGCGLSNEPVPAGPIETGPLPGEMVNELVPEPTGVEPGQSSPTPSAPTSPAPGGEAPQPDGVVMGTVHNGTDDAPVPTGLDIELRGVMVDETDSIAEFLSRTIEIEPDGSFRFEDVPFDVPFSAYIVKVIYDGVEFAAGAVVDASSPFMELPLAIYENTTDPSVITVDAMHLVLNRHPDALLVTEVIVLSNAGDRVYVSPQPVAGGRRGSILLPIPGDAYGLSFEDGELGGRFVASGGQIYDTQQVFPGQGSHTITASYILPFSGTRQVSLPITYPTLAVNVFIEEGMQISTPLLAEGGLQIIQEQAFHKYQASDLAAGQSLDMQVDSVGGWTPALQIILAMLVCLLVIASVFYWFLAARRGSRAHDAAKERLSAFATPEYQALIGRIAALDEALEAGKVNRFEWEAERAELKAKVAEKLE
ncbi:MAG: hypothetical protein JXB30_15915 [Anaerolineae bacterium]|nr:hypothetical protein [Anaerolineae bacterium]